MHFSQLDRGGHDRPRRLVAQGHQGPILGNRIVLAAERLIDPRQLEGCHDVARMLATDRLEVGDEAREVPLGTIGVGQPLISGAALGVRLDNPMRQHADRREILPGHQRAAQQVQEFRLARPFGQGCAKNLDGLVGPAVLEIQLAQDPQDHGVAAIELIELGVPGKERLGFRHALEERFVADDGLVDVAGLLGHPRQVPRSEQVIGRVRSGRRPQGPQKLDGPLRVVERLGTARPVIQRGRVRRVERQRPVERLGGGLRVAPGIERQPQTMLNDGRLGRQGRGFAKRFDRRRHLPVRRKQAAACVRNQHLGRRIARAIHNGWRRIARPRRSRRRLARLGRPCGHRRCRKRHGRKDSQNRRAAHAQPQERRAARVRGPPAINERPCSADTR